MNSQLLQELVDPPALRTAGDYIAVMVEQAETSSVLGATPENGWLTEEQQEAWRALVGVMLLLPGVLDAQLQRGAGLNFFEYLVLSSLSMEDDRSLRMSQLATLTNGSLSRLSNVVKRLEQRGWVVRQADPENGRFTRAVLTDSGWDEVVSAAPGHVDAVRQFVIDPLTAAQVRSLTAVGQRIRQRIESDERCTPACEPPDAC